MDETIVALNKKMTKHKDACGCLLGAQFMSVAVAVTMIVLLRRYEFFSAQFAWHALIVLPIAMAAAGVGKLIGMQYARYQYRRASHQLMQYLNQPVKE